MRGAAVQTLRLRVSVLGLRAVATVWLAANNHRTSGLTLTSILEKMDLADRFTAHRAVEDAKAAAAVARLARSGRYGLGVVISASPSLPPYWRR